MKYCMGSCSYFVLLIFVPHSLQKASSVGFLLPQFEHTADSGDPHLLQNLESIGLDQPHNTIKDLSNYSGICDGISA